MESDYKKIKYLLEHPDKQNKELGFQLLKGAGLPSKIDSWLIHLLINRQEWLWDGLSLGWSTQLAPFIKSIKIELGSNATLPKELFELLYLKRLYLRYDGDLNLPKLPQHFEQLQQLKELRLAGNKYSGNELSQLPPSLLKIPNLRTLHLETNNIKSLPIGLANKTSLKNLYLERNKLQEWPENLSEFNQLKFLSLKHNKLSHIPKSIQKMHNLEAINLSYNQIESLPIHAFQKLPKIHYLSIKNNPLAKTTTALLKQRTSVFILLED